MIRDAQARAWANKITKGFNTTDVPMEFCLLNEELMEAFSAWRKGQAGFGGELADVAIFLLGLAQMTGVDLEAEIMAKLALNEARAYVRLPNGTSVKEEEGQDEAAAAAPAPAKRCRKPDEHHPALAGAVIDCDTAAHHSAAPATAGEQGEGGASWT